MRIGIITPGFSDSEKDWCIPWLLNYVRLLSSFAEVQVFAMHYPFLPRCYDVYGAKVSALGGRHVRSWRRVFLILDAIKTIVTEHRRQRFDVLHAVWAGEPGVVAILAGRYLGVPALVSVMGGELVGFREIGYGLQISFLSKKAVEFSLRFADGVTVGSRHLYERCKDFLKDTNNVVIVPVGVDSTLFSPDSNHDQRSVRNVLSVGSLVPVKDHSNLLRAIRRVITEEPRVHLTFVGNGESEQELRSLADDLGISDRVTFTGAVEHHELPKYYRGAAVLALPSLHEGQGLVALEALACGVPVVGTGVGILPDLPPEICAVSRPGDSASLARNLLRFLDKADRREKISLLARGLVEKEYSIEKTVDAFMKLYQDMS